MIFYDRLVLSYWLTVRQEQLKRHTPPTDFQASNTDSRVFSRRVPFHRALFVASRFVGNRPKFEGFSGQLWVKT